MDHRYACPLRWGDMDALAHVNNVTYADYLREARHAMERDGVLDPGAGTVKVLELEYRAPLVFRSTPVTVESTVTAGGAAGETVVEQSILDRADDGAVTEYVRARTELGPSPSPVVADERLRFRVPVALRIADLGAEGAADEVAMLDLLQEGRVQMLFGLSGKESGHRVVARSTLWMYGAPRYRATPYEVRSGVGRIGRSSFELVSQLVSSEHEGAPVVLGRTSVVLVGFDRATQRSRPYTERERALLEPHRIDLVDDAPTDTPTHP
ncbi:acyl-CoA thioesterase FadM [Mumia flava]|uniref:Acyl-CoA thioesterase FadM n=1 Tax=Mumia flava TaxID=1348852 RepID=A0A2M9B8A9_9ACTN|nr:acyl-[acyl-carrier-protein] thioesterase [Mumia flava]PJJ54180.1 acyl-CoA thioesterase FadM [Mumia flava]